MKFKKLVTGLLTSAMLITRLRAGMTRPKR